MAPTLEAAADLGAGLDWKTSLQELAARLGLGAPVYDVRGRRARPRAHLHRAHPARRRGARPGRRPGQEDRRAGGRGRGLPVPAPSTSWPSTRRPRAPAAECRSCRRSRPCATGWRGTSPAGRSAPSTCCATPSVRRHEGGPADLAGRLTGRTLGRRGAARQVPVAPAGRRRGARRAPRDERTAPRARRGPDARPPPPAGAAGVGGPGGDAGAGAGARLRRPAHVRPPRASTSWCPRRTAAPGGLGAGLAALPASAAHIARDLLDPHLDRAARGRRGAQAADGAQAGAARPDPGVRDRQHLRRRGAVARRPARRTADGPAAAGAGRAPCWTPPRR